MLNRINNNLDRPENVNPKNHLYRDTAKNVHTAIQETDTADISKEGTFDLIRRQQDIIAHNQFLLGKFTPDGIDIQKHFEHRHLSGSAIVVQALRANVIEDSLKFKEDGRLDSTIKVLSDKLETDGRLKNADKMQNNPISVVGLCKIVAISPEFQLHYAKIKDELQQAGMDVSNYHIPELGDYVYVKDISVKEDRYYINKHEAKQDYLGMMVEWNVTKFDYLFYTRVYNIESIIPKSKFNKHAAPEAFFSNAEKLLQIHLGNVSYILSSDSELKTAAKAYNLKKISEELEITPEMIEAYRKIRPMVDEYDLITEDELVKEAKSHYFKEATSNFVLTDELFEEYKSNVSGLGIYKYTLDDLEAKYLNTIKQQL